MRKIFVEKIKNTLVLTGDNHKHVSLVLRQRNGQELIVCDGDGFDYRYQITNITKQETTLKLLDKKENQSETSTIELTLFTAILKGDKNETVVRTCTELGVHAIIPITTDYIAAHPDSYKQERMQKIALEAAKQSGRGKVLQVEKPHTFMAMCNLLQHFDLVVFPYEAAVEADMQTFLRETFKKYANNISGKTVKDLNHTQKHVQESLPKLRIAAIVGGEGGFSKEEVSILSNKGIQPLTLGKRILRADTACTTVCALILYEAGEMR